MEGNGKVVGLVLSKVKHETMQWKALRTVCGRGLWESEDIAAPRWVVQQDRHLALHAHLLLPALGALQATASEDSPPAVP